jgi:hypothetical protein
MVTCEPTTDRLHSAASAWHTKKLSSPPVLHRNFANFTAIFWLFRDLLTLKCKQCSGGTFNIW